MKWTHLALVAFAEPHDEASCHKVHSLRSNKDRITDHHRVNQEE